MIDSSNPLTARVVAIVPTLRRSTRLDRCLESVRKAGAGHDLKVLVIVNGGDGSRPAVPEGEVTYLETGVNLGWAGGLTFGFARTSSDFTWAVQDDMVVDSRCLTNLMKALDDDPGLAAARPLVLDARGRIQRRSGGGYLDEDGSLVRGWPMRARPQTTAIPTDFDFVTGSGMLVRSQVWRGVGGWDPGYYPVGYADVDFNQRLVAAGWKVALEPTATCTHPGSASTPTHLRFLLSFHNRRRFAQNWRSPKSDSPDPLEEVLRPHPDISREQLAQLLAWSNAVLFDIDDWLATQHIARPVSQRMRGLYWTARAWLSRRY